MKRVLLIIFALLFALASAGCAKQEEPAEKNEEPPQKQEILCGVNASSVYDDLEGPKGGEVALDKDLAACLQNASEASLFDVRVYIYYDELVFLYEGQPVEYYENAPILKAYNEAYRKWVDEVYEELDREMTEAEEAGEEYAQGWWKHTSETVFYEIWSRKHSEDTIEEYEIANRKRNAANNAYYEWKDYTDAREEDLEQRAETELSRLKAQGYDLDFRGKSQCVMIGTLSKEQIENFPAHENYGYWIEWNAKPVENKADETKRIVNLRDEGDVWDEYVPGPGDVNMSGGVSHALREAEYADCLLDVNFDIVSMGEALFPYNGTTIYEMMQSDMMEKYYESENDEDPAFQEFVEQYHEALRQLEDWDGGAACARALEEEFVRLESMGYPIVRTGGGFDAKLTQEQLKNFSFDPRYGYMVGWRYEPVAQEPQITDTVPERNFFDNFDEMAEFIRNLPDEADIQGMKAHGVYYVPSDVPEGFGLSMIMVDPYSAGVYYTYLPEEYLDLPDAEREILAGEGEAFTFEYSIYEGEMLIFAGYPQGGGAYIYLEGDDVPRMEVPL